MPTLAPDCVLGGVMATLAEDRPLLLAISGGRDSMCLLDAFGTAAHGRGGVSVAVFDHRTGPHAAEAVDLVGQVAAGWEFPVNAGAAIDPASGEAEMRTQRWHFLRRVARDSGKGTLIVTAHHLDDHIETVAMRIMRGAGARGIAGLRALPGGPAGRTEVRRPFLELSRDELMSYATARRLRWVVDPSNESHAFFRNRFRMDILPALDRAVPRLRGELDRLSRESSRIRQRLDELARPFLVAGPIGHRIDEAILHVAHDEGRRMLWAAVLELAGVVLDRRGYQRLGTLTSTMGVGRMVPLAGGYAISRGQDALWLHRSKAVPWEVTPLSPSGETHTGRWAFSFKGAAEATGVGAEWTWPWQDRGATTVRAWRPGDRWRGPGCSAARLVTRFLAEAGIPPQLREGWPVVEARGEIVWVPGVRRANAASVPSGRLTQVLCCEFLDR